MKSDKKPVIGFICVMLSCILVIGITIGLLSSAGNEVAEGSTTDTTDTTDNSGEPAAINPELIWGYEPPPSNGNICSPPVRWPCHMGYKSDKRTVDIDNVKLTLSFGVLLIFEIDDEYIEYERENGWDIPEFEIYFADESGNNIHTVREVKESFILEKYRVAYMYKEGGYYAFNHSEEITIPKELFTESEGVIKICVGGMNVAGDNPRYEVLCYEDIKYQLIENNQVVLSPRWEY